MGDLRAAGASPLPCAAEVDRQWREAAAHCPVALAVPHDRFDHPQIGRHRPPVTPPTAPQVAGHQRLSGKGAF